MPKVKGTLDGYALSDKLAQENVYFTLISFCSASSLGSRTITHMHFLSGMCKGNLFYFMSYKFDSGRNIILH